jgi:hypothetical protein
VRREVTELEPASPGPWRFYRRPELGAVPLSANLLSADPLGANPLGAVPRLFICILVRDISDAHEVGRAGRAERQAGDDNNALPRRGKAFFERNAAGTLHHIVLVARILVDDAMDAPNYGQFPPGGVSR